MNDIREQLMVDLQRIEDNGYMLNEGEVLWDYIKLMLKYIGDPLPELRDNLIYATFAGWIGERKLFNDAELREILSVIIDDEHLFYHLGSEEDPSVFTRTFSVLVVVLILQRHIEQPFLDLSEFTHLKERLIGYYIEEKDLRGYVTEGGWAHAAAHGADALEELVRCVESDEAVQLEVLAAIQGMLYNGRYVFSDDEDDRIASIVVTIIEHDLLSPSLITDWFGQLEQCCDWPRSRSLYMTRTNTKNFLRSLYFRLLHHNRGTELMDAIIKTEAKLNIFV
ncbi:hypothetical protein J2T12_003129 [Paenibacillus anaericanus]|uniref:DUF2785 domain-containing protein n=1 Tax=Paenibacillus anaericanus TaxID=170367 RepID=UPI002784678E|nr:DUF2785 domain-containing protein [Paenibacillus anaericanus]MDQ0089716.1 hypothetical protein [Paenibacillus anaericanus]